MKSLLLSLALLLFAAAPPAGAETVSGERQSAIIANDFPPILDVLRAYQTVLDSVAGAIKELKEAPFRNDLDGGLARADALVDGAGEEVGRIEREAAKLDFSRLKQTNLAEAMAEIEQTVAEFPDVIRAAARHHSALAAALRARDVAAFERLSAETFALNEPMAKNQVAVNRATLLQIDPATPQYGVNRSYLLTGEILLELMDLEEGDPGMRKIAGAMASYAAEIEREIRASETILVRFAERYSRPDARPLGGRPAADVVAEMTAVYGEVYEVERGFAALFNDYAAVARAALDGANPQRTKKRFFDLDRRLPVLNRKRAEAAAALTEVAMHWKLAEP